MSRLQEDGEAREARRGCLIDTPGLSVKGKADTILYNIL
jgi:hypothetical protein